MAMSAGRCGQHQDQENWGTTRILKEHQSLKKHRSQVLSVGFAHSWMGPLGILPSPHMAPSPHHLFHQWKVERLKFGIYNQKSSGFMDTGFIQRS